jgi:hypothetical protein
MDPHDGGVPITGVDLRYVVTWHLLEKGSVVSVGELVASIAGDGFAVAGRAGKTVSDALRWEVASGRVVRVGRARYAPGAMPRQTKSRIRSRVERLRTQVVATRWDTPARSDRPGGGAGGVID